MPVIRRRDGDRLDIAILEGPANIPPSLILGAEIFYFHDAWYRGLIGRTLVFKKALPGEEVAKLALRTSAEAR